MRFPVSFPQTQLLLLLVASACTPSREPAPSPAPQTSVPALIAPPSEKSSADTSEDKSITATPLKTTPIPAVPISVSPSLLHLPSSDFIPNWGEGARVSGQHGVVTSVEDAATRAGIEILEAGGNAVDAAVATGFALAVTHPSAGNIGGGGFLILRLGDQVEAIDFRENSPKALTAEVFWKMIASGGIGPRSVGVPGTVAGLALAHERHGKLPWAQVVAPAERLAREGYRLGVRQANTIGWSASDLIRDPVAKEAFFTGTKPLPVGSLVKRPRLAKALTRIRDQGRAGFYQGETAHDLIGSLGEGGLLTLEDLNSYQAKLREPLYFDFHGFRVITLPSPSAGGVAVAQNLLMLRELAIEKTTPNSSARYHLVAEASRRSQVERQMFVVSPDELSPEAQNEQRARALNPQTWLEKHPIDRSRATQSRTLHPGYAKALSERENTTHFSVIDAEGGLVSCTVTLSGSFGSKVFTKETGIVLNNSISSFSSMGVNTPAPGKRTTSSMAPTLALLRNGDALVLGSPGGDTIPNTVTQTFLGLALDNLSLEEIMSRPRFHQSFAPQELGMERFAPLPPFIQLGLKKLGHELTLARFTQGDANIAARIGSTSFAVSDKREGGLALAAKPPQNTAPEASQKSTDATSAGNLQ